MQRKLESLRSELARFREVASTGDGNEISGFIMDRLCPKMTDVLRSAYEDDDEAKFLNIAATAIFVSAFGASFTTNEEDPQRFTKAMVALLKPPRR